jgi:hypothetical protein
MHIFMCIYIRTRNLVDPPQLRRESQPNPVDDDGWGDQTGELIYINIYMFVWMYICMDVWMDIYIYIYILKYIYYISIHIYIYVFIYIYMYVTRPCR